MPRAALSLRYVRITCAALLSVVLGACERQPAVAEDATKGSAPGAATQSATPAQATRLDALNREGIPSGFTFALEPKPFEFPRDHGPHPEFRHEWWYVTGHLDAESGQRFGFELTFFRFALTPPPSAEILAAPASAATEGETLPASARVATERDTSPASPASAGNEIAIGQISGVSQRASVAPGSAQSAWRTRQIYMAHFAVTDLDRRTFHASEKYARDALGMAGAHAVPFRVWLDDWSLGTPPGETGSEGSSYWQLRAADKDYTFDLQLRAVTPPVLNGEAGLSRKSGEPGAASYYYSIPRLAARGRIVRDGKALDVQGLAWLDREWGSGGLGGNQQGWDWFALQFGDGATLMFYALRTREGQRDPHSAGTWFAPDGTTRQLASNDVQIQATDFWNSPRGGRYPARWQLRVPVLNLNVDVRPRLPDQELNTNPRYWEGAATITGTRANEKTSGRAYVELVGYATQPN